MICTQLQQWDFNARRIMQQQALASGTKAFQPITVRLHGSAVSVSVYAGEIIHREQSVIPGRDIRRMRCFRT